MIQVHAVREAIYAEAGANINAQAATVSKVEILAKLYLESDSAEISDKAIADQCD